MNGKISLMSQWKEFNPAASKSIKDDFQSKAYDYQPEICNYLDNGKVSLSATTCGTDILTGVRITNTYCILTDGEYSWSNTLSFYIKKYNLRLPHDFETKVLSSICKRFLLPRS